MRICTAITLLVLCTPIGANAASIIVSPRSPLQGEAVLIQSDIPLVQIQTITQNGHSIPFFGTSTSSSALLGIANNATVGTSTIIITTKSGLVSSSTLVIMPRIHPIESLAIPAQLGGNSATNQIKFVSKLSQENALLTAIPVTLKTLWTKPFKAPVANPVITDTYGYIRDSNAVTIVHKGADFKAPIGTSVAAMNRGIVVMSRYSPVYGNTIVIDHGQGVLTMYMHLSKRLIQKGALVTQGQKIALSGDSGYSEGSHLHITVRINGESIDPVEFLGLFGVQISPNQPIALQ